MSDPMTDEKYEDTNGSERPSYPRISGDSPMTNKLHINNNKVNNRRAKELAEEHWAYLDRVLFHAGMPNNERERLGFHYKSAFVHGIKHGVEDEDLRIQ